MALKCADALATFGLVGHSLVVPALWVESPHSDRLVQRSGYEVLATWAECHGVYTVLVALLALGALNKNTSRCVPNAYALVETTGSNVTSIGRHGNGGNSIFDREGEHTLVVMKIPKSDCSVARSGSNVSAVRGEVKRINVLVVAGELVADLLGGNIPNLRYLLARKLRAHPTRIELTRMILSSAPVARKRPSGLKQTLLM